MKNKNNWIGIFALLFSLPVFAGDIEISDAWIRVNAQDQESAMVGLTVTTPQKARIIAASSPAYASTEMRRLSKAKGDQTVEIAKSIPLPANKPMLLGADNYHLALIGSKHSLKAGEKVAVVLTVQYENKVTSEITVLAQPVRARNGNLPLPILSKPVKSPVIPPPIKVQAIAPEPIPAVVLAPVILEPIPEVEVALPVVIAKPIPEPIPEPVSIPAPEPAPEPIPAPATPQEPAEIKQSEQTEEASPLPVEDCLQYSTATKACDQAGELDDIMRCRKTVKSRLSCPQPD